ncbi:MAG: PAAR domain-containing protein, partial [Minicystis sp.]
MPEAGRVGDTAQGSKDEPAIGEAGQGSPDVIINDRAALRVDDPAHPAGDWQAVQGSTGVFINGRPAFRRGDATRHGDEKGELVTGSPDVRFGDARGAAPRERPHQTTVTLDITDALGRPVHEVLLRVSCPHHAHEDRVVDGTASVGGLCSGATVTVQSTLTTGTWDPNASATAGHVPQSHHHSSAKQPTGAGGDPSGGAPAKKIVQAPAPAGSANDP